MKYKLILPDGDQRSAEVVWSEEIDGLMQLCIDVSEDPRIDLLRARIAELALHLESARKLVGDA
jgi:hypothetical protein